MTQITSGPPGFQGDQHPALALSRCKTGDLRAPAPKGRNFGTHPRLDSEAGFAGSPDAASAQVREVARALSARATATPVTPVNVRVAAPGSNFVDVTFVTDQGRSNV